MYRYLSGRLRQLGYSHEDLGRALGLSGPAVSKRMNGNVRWRMDEAYKTLDFCRATPEEMTTYFPPVSVLKGKGATA